MGNSPLILAALAADAAPGVFFSRYQPIARENLQTLELFDESGRAYEFSMAANPQGERELAVEVTILQLLAQVADQLPFEIPARVGSTRDELGEPGVLLTRLGGKAPSLGKLGPGAFTRSFGSALAAIHSIAVGLVRDAGLPDFDSTAVLHSKVDELDRMAATGRVPADLLTRWERALEEVGLYRFHPTVVHGSLNSDTVALAGQEVSGITGWGQLRIGDPAEDFSWLMQGALANTQDDTLLNYRAGKADADENLLQRATLYSELEIGSWLLHCLELGDPNEIAAAEDLLGDLRQELDAGSLRDLRATSFIGLAGASLLGQMTSEIPVVKPESDELF